MFRRLAIIAALCALATPSLAQSPFDRTGLTVSISATNSSQAVALVTGSPSLWVCNQATTLAYVNFGDSTAVASATAGTPIPAGVCGILSPKGGTYIAVILASGTGTVTATPGTGALTATGGGGGTVDSAGIIAAINGPVPTNPKTTTQAKLTVAVTNTYQQLLASNASRVGCTIQYIAVAGTKGYVFFGSAPADTTTSFQLTDKQTVNCNIGGVAVAQDAINVTATGTDIFIVSSQ